MKLRITTKKEVRVVDMNIQDRLDLTSHGDDRPFAIIQRGLKELHIDFNPFGQPKPIKRWYQFWK